MWFTFVGMHSVVGGDGGRGDIVKPIIVDRIHSNKLVLVQNDDYAEALLCGSALCIWNPRCD